MTNNDELALKLKAAAEKATAGVWWFDVVETGGTYGSGDDCIEGFHSYAVYDQHNHSLLDMTNSTAAIIAVEDDGDYLLAWDEVGQRNAEFIATANPETVLALLAERDADKKRIAEQAKTIDFLKEQLAQLANFNPDWDKLEAATDSLREHIDELTTANKRIAELEALTSEQDELLVRTQLLLRKNAEARTVSVKLPEPATEGGRGYRQNGDQAMTTTQTISREWLQKTISEIEAMRDEMPFGLDEDENKTLAALKLALSAMDSEPVAYADAQSFDNFKSCGGKNAACTKEWMWRDPSDGLIPLYAAPPAPVSLPDRSVFEKWWESEHGSPLDSWDSLRTTDGYCDDGIDCQFESWNACRAAMQAEPVTAATVPDGAKEALSEAVAAIYFTDSSDYLLALFAVVKALSPETLELLSSNAKAAYDATRIAAAPAAPEQEV